MAERSNAPSSSGGEYDKLIEAKRTAYLIFGGIVLFSIVLGFLLSALGIQW